MKTDAHAEMPSLAIDDAPAQAISNTTLQVLLEQGPQHHLPDHVEGLMLGTLVNLDAAGQAMVQPDNVKAGPFLARSMVPLVPEDIGTARFVLGFEERDPRKPIILGRVWRPPAATPVTPTSTPHDGRHPRRIALQADQELELRCGKAVILLQADGHIQLRGRHLTQQAEAGLRLRAGSIQVN